MKNLIFLLVVIILIGTTNTSYAKDKIELETTVIKGNKELPKILFVVPWQEAKNSEKETQQIRLHSLFGDLFDPSTPKHIETNSQ